jgi:hypothetical protein
MGAAKGGGQDNSNLAVGKSGGVKRGGMGQHTEMKVRRIGY